MDLYLPSPYPYAGSSIQKVHSPHPHQNPRGCDGTTPYLDCTLGLDVGQRNQNRVSYGYGIQPSAFHAVNLLDTGGVIASPYITVSSGVPEGVGLPFVSPYIAMQPLQAPISRVFPQYHQQTPPSVPESPSASMVGNVNPSTFITVGLGHQTLAHPQRSVRQQRGPTDPRHPYAFRSLPAYYNETNRYKRFECFADCRKRRLGLNGITRRANFLAHLRSVHKQDIPRGGRN